MPTIIQPVSTTCARAFATIRRSSRIIGRGRTPQSFIQTRKLVILGEEKQMKDLADVALNVARQRGASYADIRISRTRNNFITTREKRVESVTDAETFGFGVRVLVDGSWGFAASSRVEKEEIARVAERAVSIAKANRAIQRSRITLVAVEKYPDAKFT